MEKESLNGKCYYRWMEGQKGMRDRVEWYNNNVHYKSNDGGQ